MKRCSVFGVQCSVLRRRTPKALGIGPATEHRTLNTEPLCPNTSPLPPASRRAGLTLIEVLLALAILGATAGVLMNAVSRCLAVVRSAKSYYDARRILDLGELDHPLLVTKDPVDGQDKVINLNIGPVSYDAYSFARSGERSPVLKDLVVVRTRVGWSARGREAFEEVTSYLYYTNDLEGL
jgi:prepilin-type N-terminal cleavage/methylation domain-containing protein